MFLGQAFEGKDARAREQGSIDLEAGILGSGSDQRYGAALDMGEYGILLRLIEAMNLVDKEDSALPGELLQLVGFIYHFAQVRHTGRDGAQRHKTRMAVACDHLGQRRFAAARWPPEDHRSDAIGFDSAAEEASWRQQLLLPHDVIEGTRSHTGCQRLSN